ncbi:ferredoxin [Kineosphaera limosa]|uniref:Putative ferredoxin n=1 Tax=Kineosphaera limosa NBRC 100340 TaxID=1184609 RepID=K6W6Q3_9MICO|nr:ferredoxin [Kineosphaera limosa]NYE00944.1 ferredoxin [Kineosphaera limosa]GAB94860.1 putative ferredoxin [Kineosphaera limosa NBRC 100340]
MSTDTRPAGAKPAGAQHAHTKTTDTKPVDTKTAGTARLGVDRVLCSGHGVCAQTLPGQVRLDEWGYPIVDSDVVDAKQGRQAVTFCPARALYLRG